MAASPLYASSVDDIRKLVSRAEPGEKLLIAIDGKVSFDEARKLWELVTTEVGPCELINVEVMYNKLHASAFLKQRIADLEDWRVSVHTKINLMSEWATAMETTLKSGGPDIPDHYLPVFLHGPKLFIDIDRAGSVDGQQNGEHILDSFGYVGEIGARGQTSYWEQGPANDREKLDRRAFIMLNYTVLQIKIKGLTALSEQITHGITLLRNMLGKSTYVGYGNCDFTGFRDLDMIDAQSKRGRDVEDDTAGGKRSRGVQTDEMSLD